MFKEIDPEKICDLESAKTVIRLLLNVIEGFQSDILSLQEENRLLRDEINHLKGEQGRPNIPKNKKNKKKSQNISSEKERKKPSNWKKKKKNDTIPITRTKKLVVDREHLPSDAQFKGYKSTIFQDILIQPDNVCFQRESFYSPSLGKSFLAPLPLGYNGQFGPGIKTYVLAQSHSCNVSEKNILASLHDFGIKISAGQVSKLVQDYTGVFQKEREAILETGLRSTPYHHFDRTFRVHY